MPILDPFRMLTENLKTLIYGALPELYAILALVATFMV